MIQYDSNALIIHIDGSAYNNPGGDGGIAAIAEFPADLNRENETIYTAAFSGTTNNRMELIACIKAIEWAHQNAYLLSVQRIIIITDSDYIYSNQHNAPYWKKAKWRNKEGRAIENSDLWNKLLSEKSKLHILTEIGWEKGKTSDISKEVDKKAKIATANIIKIKDSGYHPGKLHPTKVSGGAADMFMASGQEEIIRIYRKIFKNNANKKEYKVFFDLFSEKEKSFTSKFFAYITPEVEDKLDRGHFYKVQFNNNPKYPIIEDVIREIEKNELY
jgi:ribonuclease HI